MNTTHQEKATQSDDVTGHGLNVNVNETVDSDDVEGHTITSNVNETVDSDSDE
jgi:hypothetical protein